MKDSARELETTELEQFVLQTITCQGEGWQCQIAKELGIKPWYSERVRRALLNLEADGKIECRGWLNTKRIRTRNKYWEESNPNPKRSWFNHRRKIYAPVLGLPALSASGLSPDYVRGYNDAGLAQTFANSLRVDTKKAE